MIEDVANSINYNIKSRAEEICKCNNSLLCGLASPILVRSMDEDDQVAFPAVINNDGECKYVFSDDDYSFGIYHRIINRSYSQNKQGYGDTNYDVAIDEIVLICWGFRNQLNMDALSFENQIIVPALPKEALLIQSNFDQFGVFNGEFKNVIYNLIPEQFLFSVKYKVQYVFNRKCMEINESNKCQ